MKAEWLKALSSGKYLQGTSRLRSKEPEAYCCLGVLADIHPDITWISERQAICGDDICTLYLPPHIVGVDIQSELSDLNDSGASFEEIANLIENSVSDDLQSWTNEKE